jgi:hypothetical protein
MHIDNERAMLAPSGLGQQFDAELSERLTPYSRAEKNKPAHKSGNGPE